MEAYVCARQLVDVAASQFTDGVDGGVQEARGVMTLTVCAVPDQGLLDVGDERHLALGQPEAG
jgi:hypothetical protein